MCEDFRAFADQRHFEVGNPAAARGDAIDSVFQEAVRRRPLPFGIAGRKMRTDIAIRQRAEDGVDQSVQADVAVGTRRSARRQSGHHGGVNRNLRAQSPQTSNPPDPVIETITKGRNGVMPPMTQTLGTTSNQDAKLHLLAAYVYSLSQNNERRAVSGEQ